MDKQLFNKYRIANSVETKRKQLPIQVVDKVADELCDAYANHDYRQWYCGVIYEFGIEKVEEWRKRSQEGREPGKLFSKYVRDARTYRQRGVS